MAGRDLDAAIISALQSGLLRPCIFFEGEFVQSGSPSNLPAYLRLWSGVGPKDWGGYTWTGAGAKIGVSAITETREIQAQGFSVQLTGMDSALISTALQNVRQGKPGSIWLGFLDTDGVALIAEPYKLQRGKLDVSVIEDSGDTCTIAVQYESSLVDLERPRNRYYTHEEQQIEHPGDEGFRQVPSLQDKELIWG